MAAATAWTIYDQFKEDMLNGVMDLNADTLKIALCASTSNAATLSTANYAALTDELATANGYTSGGFGVAGTITANNFDVADGVWTAAGGSIVCRFAVLYNVTTGGLICYSLLDSFPADVTTTDTNVLNVAINVSGVFDIV